MTLRILEIFLDVHIFWKEVAEHQAGFVRITLNGHAEIVQELLMMTKLPTAQSHIGIAILEVIACYEFIEGLEQFIASLHITVIIE